MTGAIGRPVQPFFSILNLALSIFHSNARHYRDYVCRPNVSMPDMDLFVFLPGTAPNAYTQIVQTAAQQGCHAVGLQWDDFTWLCTVPTTRTRMEPGTPTLLPRACTLQRSCASLGTMPLRLRPRLPWVWNTQRR